MGVYYSAGILVGLPLKDMEEKLLDKDSETEYEDFLSFLKEKGLEIFPSCYDCFDDETAIVGFGDSVSDDYKASEYTWSESRIQDLKEKFFDITGLEAKVWLSPIVT